MLTCESFKRVVLNGEAGIRYVRQFPNVRLLVLGDVMLDHYFRGAVNRISPEAPVPIVEVEEETETPGGMGNACVNASTLGASVFPIGVVGTDEPGDRLLGNFTKNGIPTTGLIRVPGRRTTVKSRVVAGSQQIVRMDRETRAPISRELEAVILRCIHERIEAVDVVLVCDYAKGLLTPSLLAGTIDAARSAGKRVCVDPKRLAIEDYCGATVITPNIREAAASSGVAIETDADLLQAAARLKARANCAYLLVTLGEHGMVVVGDGQSPLHVPSAARQVFDVTGAGDSSIAALSLCLGVGAPIDQAMAIANCAAGIVVEKRGTAMVSSAELVAQLVERTGVAPCPPLADEIRAALALPEKARLRTRPRVPEAFPLEQVHGASE